MTLGEPFIRSLLSRRARMGKEDPARLSERMGQPSRPRPSGTLIWIHVASVGEAQSMLTLVDLILTQMPQAHILITSITTTSAQMLQGKLPGRAFHQFAPVDHPDWVRNFLDHWRPDLVLWAESELWPNSLTLLKKRNIPVALLNAHMSERSFKNWSRAARMAEDMLSVFMVILAQSEQDAAYYRDLGGRSIVVTENIKYAASPLPYVMQDLEDLKKAAGSRPLWLYASTHDGEEDLACRTHQYLTQQFPDLLTVIVPRHPARSDSIANIIRSHDLSLTIRGASKNLPRASDAIYLADTIGELGLFYRLAPLTCVGRSFSADGGGGHNPIEPAILNCAVLHGPNVQNLPVIYKEMDDSGAALRLATPEDLAKTVKDLLGAPEKLKQLQELGYSFALKKTRSLDVIIQELEPLFLMAHLPVLKATA